MKSNPLVEHRSGLVLPQTRSGEAVLQQLTDEEALALVAGDMVLIHTSRGVGMIVVERVRMGVAGEVGEEPYEVPVVESGGLVYGIPELYRLSLAAERELLDSIPAPVLAAIASGEVAE